MGKTYQQPVFLAPFFQENIWGGRKLETAFGFAIPDGNIGECWAVSGYPKCESKVMNGVHAGETLAQFWNEEPDFFGGLPEDYRKAGYPFITKIIDAKGDLSIQVHPDDAYAAVHENGAKGKTECWYILDCPEDASLVLGHNAQTKEEFVSMIEHKEWAKLLRRVPVRKGDFIQLEPGTIHAITAGVMLLETQQASDITYRVYDYDRLQNGKPRQLHIQQSIDVSTIPAPDGSKMVLHTEDDPVNESTTLVRCRFYEVDRLPVDGNAAIAAKAPFTVGTVTEGEGTMNVGGVVYPLQKGMSFILPADFGAALFAGKCNLILSMPVLES